MTSFGRERSTQAGRMIDDPRSEHGLEAIPAFFVSVVIPHYNDLPALANCVSLLEQQSYPRGSFEIIVADNNSACGIDAVRAAVPTASVIAAPIQGAGPARNAGVAASRGAVLAFIDSDCAPDSRWLWCGVAKLANFDYAGGQVITTSRDPGRPTGVEAFEIVFAFDFKRYIEKVGFTGTGNMFVPRDVFDRVGPFRYGLSEDIEWCHRARDKGLTLGYAPDAIVRHPARRDWANLKARWSRMLEEQFRLAVEQPFGRLRWAAATMFMPASILPHAWRVMRSDRLGKTPERMAATYVLAKLRIWRTGTMLKLLVIGPVAPRPRPALPRDFSSN